MKSLVLVLVFLAWFAAPARADLDSGVEAYERGDYVYALREMKPLAEQGDALAQNNLGLMYYEGKAVPQNYKEAVRWFRLSADQGNAGAQGYLGIMYYNGRGVPVDYVLAHMWLNLAAAQGNENALANRDILAKNMTSAQIVEAQKLALEWKPKK